MSLSRRRRKNCAALVGKAWGTSEIEERSFDRASGRLAQNPGRDTPLRMTPPAAGYTFLK